jgi:uncharacterized protein YcaQ
MIDVDPGDVRRVALWSVGLLSSTPTPAQARAASESRQVGVVSDMLGRLGAVQLDTISVLARSHELIAYARFGAVRRRAIEEAYWGGDAFEYWSHAACILPVESWPLFAFRRRHFRARGERWHGRPRADVAALLRRIRDDGPVTTADVGGAKSGADWWQWSDAKVALEWLLDVGEVVVSRRVGWRRTYDLPERVIPDAVLHDDMADDQCLAALVEAGARLMGIGTSADIADVHRIPIGSVADHARDVGLVPVRVRGTRTESGYEAWAHPDALTWLSGAARDRHRTTVLSPFDPLLWHRDRMERIFGMVHRLEAYTPAARRVHGYFAMPVLHRGRLVARVDPRRSGATLVAERVTLESSSRAALEGTARAIAEAAAWVGAERVEIGTVVPESARRDLQATLRDTSA